MAEFAELFPSDLDIAAKVIKAVNAHVKVIEHFLVPLGYLLIIYIVHAHVCMARRSIASLLHWLAKYYQENKTCRQLGF